MVMGIWTIGICAMTRRVWSYDTRLRLNEGCVSERTLGAIRQVDRV